MPFRVGNKASDICRFIVPVIFLFIQFTLKSQCSLGLFAWNSNLNCLTSTTNATVQVQSGGTPPYTYTWLPSGGNASVAIGITPNTYTILAQDAFGCVGMTQLIILNTTGVLVMLNPTSPTCFGDSNGKITASVSGPVTYPLTYMWNPPAANSPTNNSVSAGNHTLTVVDANGCQFTNSTTVTQPPAIVANPSTKTIVCPGAMSGVTLSVTGGTPGYSYSWAPVSGTTAVLNNIPAGSYSVTITDTKNCKLTETITINQPPPLLSNLSTTHLACNGFTTGAATANASGGTASYTYTWLPVNNNTTSISNLSAGNYSLLVKDANNCLLTQPFSITQPAPFTYTANRTDEFCINADGSATLVLNGGTAPYTYTWTTSPVQNGSVAVNLAAGNYTASIVDANGCSTAAAVSIGNISNLSPSISSKTDVSCNGGCNGNATASITGGSPPFTFNWLSIPNGSTSSVSNLCAGQYTVKITDNLGCYTFTSAIINEPPPITNSVSGVSPICSGNSLTISASSTGGNPNYVYSWQPGNLTGSVVIISPSVSTSYSVTVTDTKNCSNTTLVPVTVAAALNLSNEASSPTVCPNVNTTISVAPTGGDGSYTYTWMPGSITTQSLNVNLQSSTIFTVTVKDGCGSTPIKTTVKVTIHQTQPPTFVSDITKGCEPVCVQFNNTTAGATSVQWSFGDFSPTVISSSATHCYSKPGTYTVTLITTDANGCKSILKQNNYITVYGKPRADFINEPAIIDLNNPDAIFLNTSVNASNFLWIMDGIHIASARDLNHTFFETGCYSLKLIAANENFCSDTTEQQICVTEGYNFYAPNAFSPDGDGKNDVFIAKGTGWKTDNYTFEILDRWGNLVFKTSDIAEGWNGKMFGSKATDDVYVWRVKVVDLYDMEHEYYGKVMLMR